MRKILLGVHPPRTRFELPGDGADAQFPQVAALLLDAAEAPSGAVTSSATSRRAPAFGARAGLPARHEALPLSVLPNDLDKTMFREFAKAPEYPSDLAVVRAIKPATQDLVEWIRATGWTAPANVAGS